MAWRTRRRTELDHLVSLELGGSNDASNLWPEAPPSPNPKDEVEGALNSAVCDGQVTLAAAQDAIAADWRLPRRGSGSADPQGSEPPRRFVTPTLYEPAGRSLCTYDDTQASQQA